MSCLNRAQGNQREADYLMDCTWFEYYWRLAMYNKHAAEVKRLSDEALKQSGKK